MKDFNDVVEFHGHVCPGLALGYRVASYVMENFAPRSEDEEMVAIVENNSCAVDAIQVLTGCTFGKGNLIFRDYGKQVYTFFNRGTGKAIRLSVHWEGPKETLAEAEMWKRYIRGDRSPEVIKVVHSRKAKKTKAILEAPYEEIFSVTSVNIDPPALARVFPSVRCELCGEKVMEPRARLKDGRIVCIPCAEKE